MLHPCMQTNFLKSMEKSGILHESFRQKIHVTYKILPPEWKILTKFSCRILTEQKTITKNFIPLHQNKLGIIKTLLFKVH